MTESLSVEANLAIVVRGELAALDRFARDLQGSLDDSGGRVRLVFKTASASRLWIKEDVASPGREGGG